MKDDDVYYVSEHRGSYDNSSELTDVDTDNCDIVLFPISITRFEAEKARVKLADKGINASIFHQLWIKPFNIKNEWKRSLKKSKYGGIVLDDDYEDGVSKSIAHKLMIETKKDVFTMGLENKTAGFFSEVDNRPPNANQIVDKIFKIISNKS